MNYQWPGERVPETAIYQALHRKHSLPEEVLLFVDDEFPACKVCGDQVHYRLVRRSSHAEAARQTEKRAKAAGNSK